MTLITIPFCDLKNNEDLQMDTRKYIKEFIEANESTYHFHPDLKSLIDSYIIIISYRYNELSNLINDKGGIILHHLGSNYYNHFIEKIKKEVSIFSINQEHNLKKLLQESLNNESKTFESYKTIICKIYEDIFNEKSIYKIRLKICSIITYQFQT